ncbi:serine dehydratase subunit alpha family protein [Chakrabartyella piscis]|uniref:L-cysteine desulfidase family protein n=1 Tax=Chakrabartyella piscis TaxID=2918914 RepID=UPI0029585478|nr:L-serine ammonia-lyase, iron-sulfur-dependent, subunit alpha [Chakrabartyella piscis]
MNDLLYSNYVQILENELKPALGCTEPIALAYAAAKARFVLGDFPDHIEIHCSGNIIKNVKGVTVPNSGGFRGIEVAAILGVVGGDSEKELEVLEDVTDAHRELTQKLVAENFCSCFLQEGVENLFIVAKAMKDNHYAKVTIVNRHTLITEIEKDGEVIYENKLSDVTTNSADKTLLNVADIIDFANTVKIVDVCTVLEHQIQMNTAISQEGLANSYGQNVGKTLLATYGDDIKFKARAKAAAASDARMGGCSLPVVINSGSGNQGITVSLAVIEYAKELEVSKEQLYRALVVSNLIALHQKRYIGNLSAYCGAVSAAAGAGAAITYMKGGTLQQISNTISNTLANVGGIVCDGAKASCAAKISSSLEAAILGHHMAMADNAFSANEGILKDSIEKTIQCVGHMARVGMKSTDVEILNIMIDKANVEC